MSNADRYRALIHPLLSVLLPASFLVPLSAIVTGFLGTPLPDLATAAGVCLCAGFLATLFENIARVERVRAPGRFRFALVLIGLVYLTISLLGRGPFAVRLHPGLENVWFAFIGGLEWFLATTFQETFRSREYLLEEMEGKSGAALTIAIRDATTLTGATLSGLKTLRIMTIVFALSLAVFLVTIDSFRVPLPQATAAAILASFLLLPLVAALTGQYAFEHDAASEGFPIDEELRSRKLRVAVAMVIFPLLLAPFAAGAEAPLSPDLLHRFLAWLADLFALKAVPMDLTPQIEPGQPELIEELLRLREADRGRAGIDLSWLIAILKRVFLIAAGLGLVAFLLAPLFSKQFRAALKKRSLGRFLLRKLRELASLFRFRRHKKAARNRVEPDDLVPIREALEALTRGRRTRQKRREVGRMTKSFLALIRWGTERGVPYALSTAPGEYVRALAALPEAAGSASEGDLLAAGEIFEEALYSDHLLDAPRLADYEHAIRRVLAARLA